MSASCIWDGEDFQLPDKTLQESCGEVDVGD